VWSRWPWRTVVIDEVKHVGHYGRMITFKLGLLRKAYTVI